MPGDPYSGKLEPNTGCYLAKGGNDDGVAFFYLTKYMLYMYAPESTTLNSGRKNKLMSTPSRPGTS